MSSLLPPGFYQTAYALDARLTRALRAIRRWLGLRRPLRIQPYRGYGTPERALIKARVLEDNRPPPPRAKRSLIGSAVASYRRFATVEMPDIPVRARWNDATYEGTTDEEGFLDLWVTPPGGTTPGRHSVQLEILLDEEPARATAEVHVFGPGADYAVISDLDDTVIVTGVANLIKRAWALFMSEAATRLPFDGVSRFYGALREGVSGEADNPIFYVSSSPWNLYEHLNHFLELHGIPPGPILLRDWGLSRTGFAPGGGHGHKLAKIRGIFEALPDLRFVLIGDSGQQDPEHYVTLAREHPGRILAIYIRDVGAKRGPENRFEALAQQAREAGAELVLVPDTAGARRHAERRGLILEQAGE